MLHRFRHGRDRSGQPDGARSAERYKRALLGSAANLLAKTIGFALFAVGIRRASAYLDPDSLGLWLAVSGFAAALGFLDLGMANALTNRVAHARAQGTPAALAAVVTGGIGGLLGLGALMTVMLLAAPTVLPLADWFHLHDVRAIAALSPTLMVFGVCFGLSLGANAAVRVLVALQDGGTAYLGTAAVNLLAMVLLLGPWLPQPSIPVLLLLCYGLPAMAGLVLFIPLRQRGLLVFRTLVASLRSELPALVRPAGMYFLLQVAAAVAGGADGLLVSTSLGMAELATFAAAQKLFQLIQVPLGTINAPLWAAYADAAARGERRFVRVTLQRSLAATAALVALAGALFCLLGPWAIAAWTHQRVQVPVTLLAAFAVFTFVDALGGTFGVFLNGNGILRPQLASLVPMLAGGLALKLWLLAVGGVVPMLLGYTALYLVVTGLVYGVFNRRLVASHLA